MLLSLSIELILFSAEPFRQSIDFGFFNIDSRLGIQEPKTDFRNDVVFNLCLIEQVLEVSILVESYIVYQIAGFHVMS